MMSTQEIYNYRKVDDDMITGGQPTKEQLESAAKEGFDTIINLAPFEPGYSLPDEASLVSSLRMTYHNIPVEWENPTLRDFDAFENLVKQLDGSKTLIHCAANYRVSAFYSLYALKNLGWSEDQAEDFRKSIWQGSNYPIWEKFIDSVKTEISRSKKS